MKRRVYKAMVAGVTAILLLLQCIPGVLAQERPLDILYPSHLLPTASFNGRFTDMDLSSLQRIPSAQALNILNVLRGSGGDLMLERTANRMEGAAMLVRLLGAEQEALTVQSSHPFTDVSPWASPYIGYLYENGLTNGIGNNLYGSNLPINEKAYLTFLLRALGYSDKNGLDFTWDTVEQTARQTGLLLPGESFSEEAAFLRQRLSELSWRAMFLNHKTRREPLLVFLHEQGMISGESLEVLLQAENLNPINRWYSILLQLVDGLKNHDEKIELPFGKTFAESELSKYGTILMERANHESGVFVAGYSIESWLEGDEHTLVISPRYTNSKQDAAVLQAWVRQLVDDIIQPGMSDYEKVKTIHDFIIIALQYDTSPSPPDSSFHAFGALNTGKAVCGAYAELMVLLLNRAGVPCRMVTGTGDGLSHAWNIVAIDGVLYHVDTTWDDPITGDAPNKVIRYDYFNLTDEEMAKEHIWVQEDYPACTETRENYFVKENLILQDADALKKALKEALLWGRSSCMFRMNDSSVTEEDINDLVLQANAEVGHVLDAYMFSYNEAMGVIVIESFEYH